MKWYEHLTNTKEVNEINIIKKKILGNDSINRMDSMEFYLIQIDHKLISVFQNY